MSAPQRRHRTGEVVAIRKGHNARQSADNRAPRVTSGQGSSRRVGHIRDRVLFTSDRYDFGALAGYDDNLLVGLINLTVNGTSPR